MTRCLFSGIFCHFAKLQATIPTPATKANIALPQKAKLQYKHKEKVSNSF